ncbi:MAG: A/G-specific adenine glycosylase [Ruminococcus sp.]|uniref:A/G-specific adenine glycosylase n=1 Tax=Ruminococcus sp. TaxID=41978 RepID=UPI002872D3BF|nr:A/G-specific adenine glycosylase [Ruminococcus sp.]MBQ3284433.1 A/G-specific adenine glycosylase [Ruminococcus sp.]
MPNLSVIAAPLLEWYQLNQRDLPWRRDREPYHVWISEIMLQQTRIEAVMGYYTRFLDALPDVKSLSEVGDDALMKLWERLGYYSRARNLKKAAVMIMQEYGGAFPQTFSELKKLPGIGEYTAGAIASICYDEKVPAVDGNVLRVIARVQGSRKNVLLPEVKKSVAEQLQKIMPDEAGAFNEGLMELGELVCLPNGVPLCTSCPLKEHCTAYQKDLTAEIPVRVKTVKRRRADLSVFIITAPDGRIALEKRPDKGLLAGMYQLPNIDGFHSDKALFPILSEMEIDPISVEFIKDAKHVFTHIDWYMKAYRVEASEANNRFIWATEDELASSYPLPTAFQKLL